MPDATHQATRQQAALALLRDAGILPIVTVDSIEQAHAVAEALQSGGLRSIELTLRTPVALAAIRSLKRAFPDLVIGAGTVLSREQMLEVELAGADFIVTPGTTPTMLVALASSRLPVVCGAATPTEVLKLAEHGFGVAKLFPAAAVGGVSMLKSLHGPLPDMMFCPTGGIGEADAAQYLAQPNVACIGGSWMVPRDWLAAGDYQRVTESARKARSIVDAARAR